MITIHSGKLMIPEDERFIGFAGDDRPEEKQFHLMHFGVPGSTFSLCLRFDDGTVRTIPLESLQIDSEVLLTWNIRREHLRRTGIVTAQVKINSGDGRVIHTTRDYFMIGSAAELDDGGEEEELVTPSMLEDNLNVIKAMLPYLNDNKVYVVNEGGDVQIAKAADVYTKSEIDAVLGDLESLLSAV